MADILLVDDDVDVRTMIETLLTASGHDVVVAGDGLEAESRFVERPFDVVITDIAMPNRDGFIDQSRIQ